MSWEWTLSDLRSNKNLCVRLERWCDFSLHPKEVSYDWYRLEPPAQFELIATTGDGDRYLLCSPEQWVLYVTLEGAAGVVATSLTEWMQIMLRLPWWSGLLRFSGGGDLSRMREAHDFLSRDALEKDLSRVAECLSIAQHMGLETLADPIATLHQRVSHLRAPAAILAIDGRPFGSLLGPYALGPNGTVRNVTPVAEDSDHPGAATSNGAVALSYSGLGTTLKRRSLDRDAAWQACAILGGLHILLGTCVGLPTAMMSFRGGAYLVTSLTLIFLLLSIYGTGITYIVAGMRIEGRNRASVLVCLILASVEGGVALAMTVLMVILLIFGDGASIFGVVLFAVIAAVSGRLVHLLIRILLHDQRIPTAPQIIEPLPGQRLP